MLNPNTVYRKTDAGMHEVQTRDLGLRAELRRLLILIDGNTPVSRLATFVRGSEIDFLIAELESQALIASDSGVSVAAQMAQTAAADTAPEPTEAQVQAVRRTAVRMLHELRGPGADTMTARIERCRDSRELRQAITEIRQTLDRHLGASTGQKFLDEVRRAAENTR